MAKKTLMSRVNNLREIILLILAIGALFIWFEGRVLKAEIEALENNITLLLLPTGGSITDAPPEVVATFNVWIKTLGRKRG